MNIPDLFSLTTQTKPSSMLRKGGPTPPQFSLNSKISEELTPVDNTQTTAQASTTATTTTTSNAQNNGIYTASAPNEDIGQEFDTFLTLLTAQIKNQDPLAPLDSTQFVEQLATFSNLELQAKGNQVLEDIAQMLAQSLYTQAQAES